MLSLPSFNNNFNDFIGSIPPDTNFFNSDFDGKGSCSKRSESAQDDEYLFFSAKCNTCAEYGEQPLDLKKISFNSSLTK